MKKYLITGGAGFYGSILKEQLLKDGDFVVSVDLEPDEYKHKNFVPIKGDIRDLKLLDKLNKEYKFDAVFHCAALLAHEVKDKHELWTSNVDGTENMAKFAIKNKCKKLIFVSSNCLWGKSFDYSVTEEEKPEPVEIYGRSKLMGEKILFKYKDKLNSVIFRSPTIIDEGRLGLLSLLFEFIDDNKKIPIVGDGNNKYSFIYAKDMVQAMKQALKYNKTAIFNIGSENVKTFNEVYEYVIKKSGSKSRLCHFPKAPMIAAMKACFALHISPLGPYQYKMISSSFIFDTSKIKKELKFTPTLTNEEMLYKAYMYYHKNRKEIENREDVSAHKKNAKMGVIKLLKWMM
ncbi:MAG: NAD(P)-dependent oxidoreductase [Candidatus Saccharibacteria bacterium]|nr:NAD(P)-dependent oxidoreductase [Candidatus Saccharibacteria bacterium]